MSLFLDLPAKYHIGIKLIPENKLDRQINIGHSKIVMKTWFENDNGPMFGTENYNDFIFIDEKDGGVKILTGLDIEIPPTKMRFQELILFWVTLGLLTFSVIFHVLR